MAPLFCLFALALEALSVYQFLEFFFFFSFAIQPISSTLTRLRTIRWQFDDFVALEFVVHSSVGSRGGNGAEG